MREIGSEYWTTSIGRNNNDLNYLNIGQDYKLLMSGRTAIDYVLNEINDKKKIVYMPDYCCESMIKPFLDNGYKINYYKVDAINNKYNININFDCSVFFAMSYFGYNITNMDNYIEIFNNRNIIVIEDITHRFLCDKNHCNKSTYLIASLRKWFPILSGGVAINMHNYFNNNLDNYTTNIEFLKLKQKAMDLKKNYMNGYINDKIEFLDFFNKSNSMMNDYKNKKIDEKSEKILKKLDIDSIRNNRINNCKIIHNKIKNIRKIKLLYEYNEGDCPLFVPIVINNRDIVRKRLIEKSIYLPVHWPNNNNINNDIYNNELSLINDQRYTEKDIDEYINKLIEIAGD